jgi:hypothetical protein
MAGECLICHRFQPIQLNLDGVEVPNYLYVCFKCKPMSGMVILCKDDDQRLDITDDEAKRVFYGGVPPRRVALVDQRTRDKILSELLSEDDRREMERLKEAVIDINGNIASLQDEISDMEIEIDEKEKEVKDIMTYRLQKVAAHVAEAP